MVLNTELCGKYKITAINELAIPIVSYGFGIINWTIAELQNLDRKTRKILTCNKMHHPRACVERLYAPRSKGGRGLLEIEAQYKAAYVSLNTYLRQHNDALVRQIRRHEERKNTNKTAEKLARKFKQEQNFHERDVPETTELATHRAKSVSIKFKECQINNKIDKWHSKALHGQFFKQIEGEYIDKSVTFSWLKYGHIKSETESLIIAAQDQAIATNIIKANIHKTVKDGKCRICGKFDETIQHLIAACPVLAKVEYIDRHNKVASFIHWKICQEYNIEVSAKWYTHTVQTVIETAKIKLLWDMGITTDRTVVANRPDIIILHKDTKYAYMIDISIPNDVNINKKEVEKLTKYKNLSIEMNRLWSVRSKIIPVVIGALGTVSTKIGFHLDKIPIKIDKDKTISEIQKIAILGTSHIIRKIID